MNFWAILVIIVGAFLLNLVPGLHGIVTAWILSSIYYGSIFDDDEPKKGIKE